LILTVFSELPERWPKSGGLLFWSKTCCNRQTTTNTFPIGRQGHLEQARAIVDDRLPQLEIEHLYGVREPFRVYLTCYLVLQAGHDPRAEAVLATAYRLLQERAAEIVDERLRRFYIENVPAHREIGRAFSHQIARPM